MSKTLAERMIKNTTLNYTSFLNESAILNNKNNTLTDVPMLNVAFSGRFDMGFKAGMTIWAGPSKHFKTNFALLQVKMFLDSDPEAVCLFYDSEFGAASEYFEVFGINPSRIIHTPITDIEELTFDMANQLDELTRQDKVIILVDSIGNLASKKEKEDALDQKSKVDMTRAKSMKSWTRIVTSKINLLDIPTVVVAHTYDTQEMFSKKVVSGGTGLMYSANEVFILGKQQIKDGKELQGFNFVVNVEKSRTIKEKSIIPVTVTYDGGIDPTSGLLDVAIKTGHIVKPSMGWYALAGDEENKLRKKDLDIKFWQPLLEDNTFIDAVESIYSLGSKSLFTVDDVIEEDL